MTRSEAGRLGALKTVQIRKEQAIARYRDNPKFCLLCGAIITVNDEHANHAFSKIKYKKFCNQSCAAKYNNKKFVKRKRESRVCLRCSTPLNWWAKKFCSRGCFTKYRQETNDIFQKKTEIGSLTLRRAMLRNDVVYQCAMCGIGPEWNKQTLVLQADHKDGNSSNNILNNLRFLCPNCHSQTPTYGIRNKGSGRLSRRVKREEGI